jgi:hypothetical protein
MRTSVKKVEQKSDNQLRLVPALSQREFSRSKFAAREVVKEGVEAKLADHILAA